MDMSVYTEIVITRLHTSNYRAFENLDIPLTKINLFFGPNNSGKSAVLSALNLLAQTVSSDDPEVPLLLNGKLENLGTYKDIVYKNGVENNITFGIEFDLETPDEKWVASKGFLEVMFHYRQQRKEIVVGGLNIQIGGKEFLTTRIAKKGENQIIEKCDSDFSSIKTGARSSGTIELKHFLPTTTISSYNIQTRKHTIRHMQYRELELKLRLFRRSFMNRFTQIEFIGPFRHPPERIYSFSGETPSSLGVHGEKAIDILAIDRSRRQEKKMGIAASVSKWLKRFEMAESIEVVPLTGRHFEIKVVHYATKENETLADVGYGCSQILPILIAGYFLGPNNSLLIAEPEIHLHPKAQAEVGSFLYEVSNRGIQLFIETHSEHLLLRLQSHIAEGNLKPEDVNVFYLYSEPNKEKKLIKQIPIGKDGFFLEPWPKGFFPERLEEAKRLARFSVDDAVDK